MAALDAARCHAVWQMLVRDEELCDAVLAGAYDHVLASRQLDATDAAILDAFGADPAALRWNIGNLRFRGSLDTMLKLRRWMPLTAELVSAGRMDWLADLCFGYLASHRWVDLGHRHFAECLRFADYVRDRIGQGRRLPAHLDTVLEYETALCALLAETATVAAAAWPPTWETGRSIAERCPRPGPVTRLVELTEDISEWISEGRPVEGAVRAEPLTLLMFVPPGEETFCVAPLDVDQKLVFGACTGARTSADIAEAMARQSGFRPQDVLALLGVWVDQGALVLP